MKDLFSDDFIVKATKAERKSSAFSNFDRVGTDSRAELNGAFFIALKGESFDGHDFVKPAVEKGAKGVLVHEWRPEYDALTDQADFFLVKDTLIALQLMARAWREQCGFKVVGITGSNGKTTTKELCLQLIKDKFKTSASPGSFNNHWGVPLSLLRARPGDQVVLQEMGMNHRGELSDLCLIARPDVVVVTNVGTAHIGELGSIQEIKEAKNEIYLKSPKAVQIFNMDNEHTMSLYENALKREVKKNQLLTFSSFNSAAQIYLRAGTVGQDGVQVTGRISGVSGGGKMKAFGRQTVVNLMAACGIAVALGMKPEEIFARFDKIDLQSWGRNQWIAIPQGPSVIFDGYNANPDSMKMLLKNLYELELKGGGGKSFVFGDMRELGDYGEAAHKEVAELAGQIGLSSIWYMGKFGDSVKKALDKVNYSGSLTVTEDYNEEQAKRFYLNLKAGDIVALKASRGSRIERVLSAWGVDGF